MYVLHLLYMYCTYSILVHVLDALLVLYFLLAQYLPTPLLVPYFLGGTVHTALLVRYWTAVMVLDRLVGGVLTRWYLSSQLILDCLAGIVGTA